MENSESKFILQRKIRSPQVAEALGLLNVKPRLFKPFSQSICIPYKYFMRSINYTGNTINFKLCIILFLIVETKYITQTLQPPPLMPTRNFLLVSGPVSLINLFNSCAAIGVKVTGAGKVVSIQFIYIAKITTTANVAFLNSF